MACCGILIAYSMSAEHHGGGDTGVPLISELAEHSAPFWGFLGFLTLSFLHNPGAGGVHH